MTEQEKDLEIIRLRARVDELLTKNNEYLQRWRDEKDAAKAEKERVVDVAGSIHKVFEEVNSLHDKQLSILKLIIEYLYQQRRSGKRLDDTLWKQLIELLPDGKESSNG